jgi:WD40 repeat protein
MDEKSTVYVFSLYSQKLLSSFSPPGVVQAIETDPSLDWLLLGLQNGSIYAYDIDRGNLTSFRLDNLQKRVLPNESLSPVVSIQWNPRDIGTLLIAYTNVALIYSLATDEIRISLRYELPPQAPGGDGKNSSSARYPRIIQSEYHPNSLNVVTAHEDGSLVFWDALSGELLQARSLFDVNVNVPQTINRTQPNGPDNHQFIKLKWICHADPDDTSLIIAGGDSPKGQGIHNLSVMHFGTAPKYSLTSYEKMGHFYATPKQQRFLPIQNPSSVLDFIPLATRTPFFDGGHDPQYLLILLESGELENLAFPSGTLSYKSSLFPQSIAWIHPRTTVSEAFVVPRKQWLGMVARSSKHENILRGGFPAKKPLKPNEIRSALATGHVNGSVRLYDASHNELEDSSVLEVNVAQTLNSITDVAVHKISFAGETAELAVATAGGDIVLYKFDVNKKFNPQRKVLEENMNRLSIQKERKLLVDLTDRTPNVRDGFLPICAIHGQRGRVTALKNSNVGFVAIAYECGDLIIVDRRGPAVIFEDSIRRKSGIQSSSITAFEFSIMVFGDDNYSSILLFAGTDKGETFTYKVLPETSGRFSAQLVDVVQTNDKGINNIVTYKLETGTPATATFDLFHQLADGLLLQGSVLIVSSFDVRILVPGKAKSSHKIFNLEILASSLTVLATKSTNSKPYASCVPTLLADGSIKILSLPELKEITSLALPRPILPSFERFSTVLPSGDILVRTSQSQACLVRICGSGISYAEQPQDRLFNDHTRIPCRPQIGAAQWMRGNTLIGVADLDSLIGGDRRSRPKTKESEIAHGAVLIATPSNGKVGGSDAGDFLYEKPVRRRQAGGYDPTRSIVRTFQNGYDTVGETFNEYANNASQSMNETIGQAKKDLVKGMFRSKFGI